MIYFLPCCLVGISYENEKKNISEKILSLKIRKTKTFQNFLNFKYFFRRDRFFCVSITYFFTLPTVMQLRYLYGVTPLIGSYATCRELRHLLLKDLIRKERDKSESFSGKLSTTWTTC